MRTINITIERVYIGPLDIYFTKLNDGYWQCIKAKPSMLKFYKEFKEQFPGEDIIYKCYREPSYGPNGGISSVNKNPRVRAFSVKFSDPANEAVFLMKYIAEQ